MDRQNYTLGKTEVIIIDSSKDESKTSIAASCKKYDAIYLEGMDSVRKKRNLGIHSARYEHILFIDSDVTVKSGLLNEYANVYLHADRIRLGGVLGYTEFVGEKSFWWRILELTNLVDSFSFAREYPFHSWTIGNNVSFKKCVLEEIGMFEENFPFKLGGDDLDMSYRVTKSGYMIISAPNAVAYHSRDTWNNVKAIHDRAKRWGTMEFFICERHPELLKQVILKNYVIELLVLLLCSIFSLVLQNPLAIFTALIWFALQVIWLYVGNGLCSTFKNPLFFYGAQMVQMVYEFYRIKESLRRKSLAAFHKSMVFNVYQIKYGIGNDAKRIWMLGILFFVVLFLMKLIMRQV